VTGAALLSALLLAAPIVPPAAGAGAAAAAPGQRAEIVVRFPPWQFTGTFTFSCAGLEDQGVARDRGSLVGPDASVERVLEGARGTLTLTLRDVLRGIGFPAVFGRWEVRDGTGAYAGLAGGGTFTSVDGGTGKGGSPLEFQTLLGRVRRR
jgi:hypothetical protein